MDLTDWRTMPPLARCYFAHEQGDLQRTACRKHFLSIAYGGSGIARPEGISAVRWSAMLNHYKREVWINESNRSNR